MNCERCGEKPARVQYREIKEGKSKRYRICEDCATELGFSLATEDVAADTGPTPAAPQAMIILEAPLIPKVLAGPPDERCDACGLTLSELQNQSRFGCPGCYRAFEKHLDAILRRIHGATLHRGRLPGGEMVECVDVNALRRDLRAAILAEDFEKAAGLRDRLRSADPAAADEEAANELRRDRPPEDET